MGVCCAIIVDCQSNMSVLGTRSRKRENVEREDKPKLVNYYINDTILSCLGDIVVRPSLPVYVRL